MLNRTNEPKVVSQVSTPRYRQIYDALAQDIRQGRAKPGQKLASEAALIKRFSTSRITVTRALRELQQSGLVERVAGSGTYVRKAANDRPARLTFGLIIPDLGETEIFEPICQGIATAEPESEHALFRNTRKTVADTIAPPEEQRHSLAVWRRASAPFALLWGHAHAAEGTKREQALELCEQYIERQVAGVFFAPIEGDSADDAANAEILRLMKEAKVPVVLLDRRTSSPLETIRPDLAGIDNVRAGFVATSHLLSLGAQDVAFVARRQSAPTIVQRAAGFLEARALFNRSEAAPRVIQFESIDEAYEALMREEIRACVCANDRIAGELMHVVLQAGLKIPEDFRIAGIDDVNYASLLPVPLTTVRQPCREIGRAALQLMIERIKHPAMPAREVLLDCDLIIRRSCGAKG